MEVNIPMVFKATDIPKLSKLSSTANYLIV